MCFSLFYFSYIIFYYFIFINIFFSGGNPYEAEMEAEIQEEFIRREDRNNIQTREQVAFEVG